MTDHVNDSIFHHEHDSMFSKLKAEHLDYKLDHEFGDMDSQNNEDASNNCNSDKNTRPYYNDSL